MLKKPVLLIIIIVIGLPTIGIGVFASNCQIQRYRTNKDYEPTLERFESIYLLDEASRPPTEISRGGDCFDSRPWVSAKKTQSVSLKAGEAMSILNDSFVKQGYTIDEKQTYYSITGNGKTDEDAGCGLTISSKITSDKDTFNLNISSDKKGCDRAILEQKKEDRNYSDMSVSSIVISARKE